MRALGRFLCASARAAQTSRHPGDTEAGENDMTSDTQLTATDVMPDFRDPEFFRTMIELISGNAKVGDAYLMALTALIHGLDVRFFRSQAAAGTRIPFIRPEHVTPQFYRISQGKRAHYFWASGCASLVTEAGARNSRDKTRGKPMLHRAGVRTPAGGAATAQNLSIFQQLAAAGVKRVLVKPAEGSLAKGVRANLSLADAQAHVLSNPTVTFAVEEFIRGTEYRVYTVGKAPVLSLLRLPKHVVGDGITPVGALIERKIFLQRRNPRSWNRALDREEALSFLHRHGVSPDHVPAKGTLVRLTDTLYWESIDAIDCTHAIEPDVTEMAVRAAKVFGLGFSAVDLIKSRTGKVFVLEVNARPGLDAAAFPLNAPWTLRLPEAILRQLFPRLVATPRRVNRFDMLQLVQDYRARTDVTFFDASDYVDCE